MDPERRDDFHNEVSMYKRLQCLQGSYVPRYFGSATSESTTPALLLSYVVGTPLNQLDLDVLVNPSVLQAYRQHTTLSTVSSDDIPNPRLACALKEMFDELSKCGVVHGDDQLHNFLWANDRVVAIDFEFAYLLPHNTTNIPYYYGLVHDIGRMIDYWSLEDPVAKEERRRVKAERFDKWWAELRAIDRIRPSHPAEQNHSESPLPPLPLRRPDDIFFKIPTE
ncbi:hypothetical protein F4678DRAFT_444072 [Xylaria arbuscula]|nr:hypothetical protein F4678DRAFT_444072 [Xylaria arbuscula]